VAVTAFGATPCSTHCTSGVSVSNWSAMIFAPRFLSVASCVALGGVMKLIADSLGAWPADNAHEFRFAFQIRPGFHRGVANTST
jgi:hypothetical protein